MSGSAVVPLAGGPMAHEASPERRLREDQLRLGLWMFLATVTMLFAAFTSAYIVRRSGSDWRHVSLPSILWLNTAVLAVSSALVELANCSGRGRRWPVATALLAAALTGGLAFLAGQVVAWRQMVSMGIYLPSSPHSSFFFMLTGAHAVHLVAALAALAWGLRQTWLAQEGSDPFGWSARMELCRTFWHYLGGIWLFLFALVTIY